MKIVCLLYHGGVQKPDRKHKLKLDTRTCEYQNDGVYCTLLRTPDFTIYYRN